MRIFVHHPARRQCGMTLIEVMMVIGIIGITLTLGMPSMVTMVQDMRMTSSANDYLTFVNVARSEAGKRGTRITLCATGDYVNCSAAASDDWGVGAMAFVDTDADGVVDAGETVVRVLDPIATGYAVTGVTTTGGANAGRFIYRSSGTSDSLRAFQLRKGAAGRNICVSLQGRASVQAVGAACP